MCGMMNDIVFAIKKKEKEVRVLCIVLKRVLMMEVLYMQLKWYVRMFESFKFDVVFVIKKKEVCALCI